MTISTPHFTPLKFPSSIPSLYPCPMLFIFSLIFDDPLSPINVAVYTWLHGHSQEHRKIRVEMPSKENNCPSPSSYQVPTGPMGAEPGECIPISTLILAD